ncbi:MAG: cyanophycinase [Candidatus Thermoplasmatota archaeon]|nr:cyanophycinase [Candidatus Thermoplasmatota archaeon]
MSEEEEYGQSSSRKIPKGLLIAVGGNEDKEYDLFILRKIVSLAGKGNKKPVRIELITTASEVPNEVAKSYRKAFSMIDGNHLGTMHIHSREEASDPALLRRIKKADMIFFSGGDQLRITSILGGSPVLKEIRSRYFHDNIIVAGTSAGAAAMPETMIYGGTATEALLKGAVQMTAGIGLIGRVIIDSHFIKRGRFSRLMQIIASNPGHIGLGLGEDTGVVIEKGRYLKAIGSGLVVIFDGQDLRYTNITDISENEAIAIENIRVHTIVKGFGYDLMKREYLKPQDIDRLNLVSK